MNENICNLGFKKKEHKIKFENWKNLKFKKSLGKLKGRMGGGG